MPENDALHLHESKVLCCLWILIRQTASGVRVCLCKCCLEYFLGGLERSRGGLAVRGVGDRALVGLQDQGQASWVPWVPVLLKSKEITEGSTFLGGLGLVTAQSLTTWCGDTHACCWISRYSVISLENIHSLRMDIWQPLKMGSSSLTKLGLR